MENMIIKQRGITLVSLVITIIILLILAGVALSLLTSGEGVLSRVNSAKTVYYGASSDESDKYDYLLNQLNEYSSIKYVCHSVNDEGYLITVDNDGCVYVSESPLIIDTTIRYLNTGIKLQQVSGIKAKYIIDNYVFGNNDKLYTYNSENNNFIEMFNGVEIKQLTNIYSLPYVLGYDGDIYKIENNQLNKLNFENTKFTKIVGNNAISTEGEVYNIYYGSKKNKLNGLRIIDYNNNYYLGADNNLYNSNGEVISNGIKIIGFFEMHRDYSVDENDNLYYSSYYFYPMYNYNGIQLKASDIVIAKESSFVTANGEVINRFENDYNLSLQGTNIKIKDIIEDRIMLSTDGDLYSIDRDDNDDYVYTKIDSATKVKSLFYNGVYCFLDEDNKLYGIRENWEEDPENNEYYFRPIVELVDNKYVKCCLDYTSKDYTEEGYIVINEDDEICTMVEYQFMQ